MSAPLLQFPCRYPIKVFGHAGRDLQGQVETLLADQQIEYRDITERASRGARFVAVHFDMQAISREQIESLAAALKGLDGVVMVL